MSLKVPWVRGMAFFEFRELTTVRLSIGMRGLKLQMLRLTPSKEDLETENHVGWNTSTTTMTSRRNTSAAIVVFS